MPNNAQSGQDEIGGAGGPPPAGMQFDPFIKQWVPAAKGLVVPPAAPPAAAAPAAGGGLLGGKAGVAVGLVGAGLLKPALEYGKKGLETAKDAASAVVPDNWAQKGVDMLSDKPSGPDTSGFPSYVPPSAGKASKPKLTGATAPAGGLLK